MDEHTVASAAPSDQISFLFGEGGAQNSREMHHNPFSSYSYFQQHQHVAGEDSGAGSEEGPDLPGEPTEPARHRSGSKRSRAAEVHNLSEKRRRSRINEKMKALQNLIPNSNKTDKASMLDEVIEYLKQLQLQVQMLSMRNGLNSHPMYLPGALHQLQASQLCMSFGDTTSAMNMVVLGMLPHNPDSAPNNSFHLTSRCMASHQTVMLPTASISAPETSFELEPLQSHHPSFKLRIPSEEICTEDTVSQQKLDSGRNIRNLAENEMKTMDVARSLHFGGQGSSSLEHSDHLEDVLHENHQDNNPGFSQNFDGIRTGRSFTNDDVKPEELGI